MDMEEYEEITQNKVLGIFKKIGFVYPSRQSFVPELGICIKDKKIIITGKIEAYNNSDKILFSFTKKKPYSKVYGLDEESSNIEIYEDVGLFGYRYEILVPKQSIVLAKPVL
jgi:hypothetical protein